MAFKMQNTINTVVQHTAAATLRQIVIFLFEKIQRERKNVYNIEKPEFSLLSRYSSILNGINSLSASELDAFLVLYVNYIYIYFYQYYHYRRIFVY